MTFEGRTNTSPVFQPLKKRSLVLGMGGKEWGVTILTAAVAAALAFLLGFWTHIVEAPIDRTQANEQMQELLGYQGTVVEVERLMEAAGTEKLTEIDIAEDQANTYTYAKSIGISAEDTREDMATHIPETLPQEQPVIPDIPRYLVLALLPTLAGAGIQIEFSHGTNAIKEIKRLVRNARKQHVYRSRPKDYLKRIAS